MFKIFIFIFTIILFTSCSSSYEKPLKISVNSWVGYSPLFYAHEKGWLKKYNIEILKVVSLAESMHIYSAKNVDAFTGTQYEYKIIKKRHTSLTPLIMFDKSFGGDMIFGNMSISDIQESKEKIDVYLELDSVNAILFKDFISHYNIDEKRINYINKDQEKISHLINSKKASPTLIVTYSPYDLKLKKQGYQILFSTKEALAITVVDALYATKKTYLDHKKQFNGLKVEIDKAIEALQKNPEDFFSHAKHYLQGMSYEEFSDSLDNIQWINKSLPPKLIKKLYQTDYPLDGLI